MEHVWAGWRFPGVAGFEPGIASDGQPHADLTPAEGESLFETIERSGLPDDETYIVHRGHRVFVILNVFPYNPGHLMVLPKVAAPSIDDLDPEVFDELWWMVRRASRAVKAAFRPDGVNIGINEGRAGGGSVPDHLHVHLVPRWRADTNFVTTTANTRVLPIALVDVWQRLRDAWPDDDRPPAPGVR